jgi:hypothetical protein
MVELGLAGIRVSAGPFEKPVLSTHARHVVHALRDDDSTPG